MRSSLTVRGALALAIAIAISGPLRGCGMVGAEELATADATVEIAATVAGSPVRGGKPAILETLDLEVRGCKAGPTLTYTLSRAALSAGIPLTQADTGCRAVPTRVVLREGNSTVSFRRGPGENATAAGTRTTFVDGKGRALLMHVASQVRTPARAKERVEFLFVPVETSEGGAAAPEAKVPGPSGELPLFLVHALAKRPSGGPRAYTLYLTCDGVPRSTRCVKTAGDGTEKEQAASELRVALEVLPEGADDPAPATFDEAYAKAIVAPFLSRPYAGQVFGSFLAIELQDAFDLFAPGKRWRVIVLHDDGAAATYRGVVE